jgi:fumarylpyruvate hydrolase
MSFVVEPFPRTTVPVVGTDDLWPVRRVFCVGRNYADHAVEMGGDPTREPPFFFMKPADAVVPAAGTVRYPPLTADLQHEVELVIAIGPDGIAGYAVGVDLTRRDLQASAKAAGKPWEWGKAFDESAPITPIVLGTSLKDSRIWLAVNHVARQDGFTDQMTWKPEEIVAQAALSVSLQPGDLIFTGTPAGVGTLVRGDVVTGGVDGVGEFSFVIA